MQVAIAYGPFWGFIKGYVSWLSGVLDNSLYPILFLDCLLQLVDKNDESIIDKTIFRVAFVSFTTLVLSYINYRGLDIVGNVAIVLSVVSMLPFIVMCFMSIFSLKPERWLTAPEGGFYAVDWGLLLNTFFWNINFWESAACFSGDVANPGVTFPRGIMLAVVFVGLSSFLAILFTTGASASPYYEWTDGFFVHVADEIGGPWLGAWMMFAAAITNIGLFEAEMSSDALQIAGMADRGILPKFIGIRSKFGTPIVGIAMSAFCVIILSGYDFADLVEMLNLLFCFGQSIEFCAFLHLRYYRMDLYRPYTIPLSFTGCVLMLIPPFAFMVIIMALCSPASMILCIVSSIFGVFLYYFLEYLKTSNIIEFHDDVEDNYMPNIPHTGKFDKPYRAYSYGEYKPVATEESERH